MQIGKMTPEALPSVPKKPKTERGETKKTGQQLAHEMLVNLAMGGDAQETRKMLELSVLQSVTEHFRYNPKKYLDILKEPPFQVDLNNPNTPGLKNLAQLVSNELSMRPEWKALSKRIKEAAAKGPLGSDLSAEAYNLISDATTDAIRKAHDQQTREAA